MGLPGKLDHQITTFLFNSRKMGLPGKLDHHTHKIPSSSS